VGLFVAPDYLHAALVAAAMIDRLVHHAEIVALKGDSYRLRDRDLGGPRPAQSTDLA
jgi:DNA replication protein DnaC